MKHGFCSMKIINLIASFIILTFCEHSLDCPKDYTGLSVDSLSEFRATILQHWLSAFSSVTKFDVQTLKHVPMFVHSGYTHVTEKPNNTITKFTELVPDSAALALSFYLRFDSPHRPGAFEIVLPIKSNNISDWVRKKIFVCSMTTLCKSDYPSHHQISSKSFAWQSLDVSSLVWQDVVTQTNTKGVVVNFTLMFDLSLDKLSEHYQLDAINGPLLLVYPKISKIAAAEARTKRSTDKHTVLQKLDKESKRENSSMFKESINYEIKLRMKKIKEKNDDIYGCELRHLNVSFDDLGWTDQIVYPRYVEANYCIGNCQHPPNGRIKMNRTSHAFIRSSFMRKKLEENSTAEFPKGLKPCCVPARLAPMSLLYQINGTIYKADLNEMKVEKCACL